MFLVDRNGGITLLTRFVYCGVHVESLAIHIAKPTISSTGEAISMPHSAGFSMQDEVDLTLTTTPTQTSTSLQSKGAENDATCSATDSDSDSFSF